MFSDERSGTSICCKQKGQGSEDEKEGHLDNGQKWLEREWCGGECQPCAYYITGPSRKSEQEALCLQDLFTLLLKAKLFTFPIPRSRFQVPKFRSNVHPISHGHKQGIFAKKEIQAGWQ